MKIIAKTKDGCLIEATESEIKSILGAVLGEAPKNIEINQKIPAIDYASSIRKIKSLPENFEFKQLVERTNSVAKAVASLSLAVEDAANVEY